mmetsp:Transcript_57799/g.103818  ORF Transcript_57799/g.103818 Transcript_57799/m.103818 type:complete len:229 (+) Transcript_57799:3427-4113(+)
MHMPGDLHGGKVREVHGVKSEANKKVLNLREHSRVAEDALFDDELEDGALEVCQLLRRDHVDSGRVLRERLHGACPNPAAQPRVLSEALALEVAPHLVVPVLNSIVDRQQPEPIPVQASFALLDQELAHDQVARGCGEVEGSPRIVCSASIDACTGDQQSPDSLDVAVGRALAHKAREGGRGERAQQARRRQRSHGRSTFASADDASDASDSGLGVHKFLETLPTTTL